MAERKWKKDQLSVSLASLKELMFTHQCTIREARNNYFSEPSRVMTLEFFLKLLILWLSPLPASQLNPPQTNVKNFVNTFLNKIVEIQQHFKTDFMEMVVDSCPLSTFPSYFKHATVYPLF